MEYFDEVEKGVHFYNYNRLEFGLVKWELLLIKESKKTISNKLY